MKAVVGIELNPPLRYRPARTSAENAIEGAQIITIATADKQLATILTSPSPA